jgi:hypothetical protein
MTEREARLTTSERITLKTLLDEVERANTVSDYRSRRITVTLVLSPVDELNLQAIRRKLAALAKLEKPT